MVYKHRSRTRCRLRPKWPTLLAETGSWKSEFRSRPGTNKHAKAGVADSVLVPLPLALRAHLVRLTARGGTVRTAVRSESKIQIDPMVARL